MSNSADNWEAVMQAEDKGERSRIMLSPDEAARALGMSRRFFDAHVLPQLRVVRLGSGTGQRRRTYIPVREIYQWADASAVLWRDGPSLAPSRTACDHKTQAAARSASGRRQPEREKHVRR